MPVLHCHFSVISTPVKSCTEPLEKREGIQSGLLKICKETFSLDGDKFDLKHITTTTTTTHVLPSHAWQKEKGKK